MPRQWKRYVCCLAAFALSIGTPMVAAQGITAQSLLVVESPPAEKSAGKQTSDDDSLPLTIISSTPQPEPDPPLKYSLAPEYLELVTADAATCYYRAILLLPKEEERQFGDTQNDWLTVPLEQFPVDLAKTWLTPYSTMLGEVEKAAYRNRCEWDIHLHDLSGVEIMSIRLPEIQQLREIARILRLKSRLEIAEGNYDEARQTILISYRLAQHIAESPLLINQLVAVAIAGINNNSIEDWINSGGPNLYWGLASLTSPLIDIRTSVQMETSMALRMFPYLKNPEELEYTPQEWRHQIAESLKQLTPITGARNAMASAMAQTTASGLMLAAYPGAKAELIRSGMDAKEVEAMPVGKVVAIQTARSVREVIDESTKWTFLPFWQGYKQMGQSLRQLHETGHLGSTGRVPGVMGIVSMVFPATEAAVLAPARMQRDIAALQTIEAIRMKTAQQNGSLPASLADLNDACPAPLDPITGKPFVYIVRDEQALLELPPPVGRDPGRFGKRFQIELQAETKIK